MTDSWKEDGAKHRPERRSVFGDADPLRVPTRERIPRKAPKLRRRQLRRGSGAIARGCGRTPRPATPVRRTTSTPPSPRSGQARRKPGSAPGRRRRRDRRGRSRTYVRSAPAGRGRHPRRHRPNGRSAPARTSSARAHAPSRPEPGTASRLRSGRGRREAGSETCLPTSRRPAVDGHRGEVPSANQATVACPAAILNVVAVRQQTRSSPQFGDTI